MHDLIIHSYHLNATNKTPQEYLKNPLYYRLGNHVPVPRNQATPGAHSSNAVEASGQGTWLWALACRQ